MTVDDRDAAAPAHGRAQRPGHSDGPGLTATS